MADKWMAGAFSNKGALHRQLGVPEDQPIPASKLAAAKNKARAQIEKAEAAGRAAPASAVKTSRRVALAQRAKSGDISKMQGGGTVSKTKATVHSASMPQRPPTGMTFPHPVKPGSGLATKEGSFTLPAPKKGGKGGKGGKKLATKEGGFTLPKTIYRMEDGGVVTTHRARDLVLEGLDE